MDLLTEASSLKKFATLLKSKKKQTAGFGVKAI